MMDTTRLAAMANQIAAFFATQRGKSGAAEVADHLRKFWEPRMRRDMMTRVDEVGSEAAGLSPLAAAGIAALRDAPSALSLPGDKAGDGSDRAPLGTGTNEGSPPDAVASGPNG